MKFLYFIFLIFFFSIFFDFVYAVEPILISISSNLDQVVFDGKWTNPYEWKKSSYNKLEFDDDARIHLRTAHQGNFIYIQIDFESDQNIDKGYDSAIVCFDTENDKTIFPQTDDYCFSTTIDVKKPFTYQGNNTEINNSFSEIPNNNNFLAVGAASDKNDRYSKIPHTSYEFRIPLEILGRSNNYGFYISVFDANSKNYYSWPYDIQNQSSISSPSQWGDLISPDNSLPEFDFSFLFFSVISLIMFFTIITKFDLFKTDMGDY